MLRGLSRLGRGALNPVTRTAILTFAWAHRHEVMRWGRSLSEHLARRDLSPAALLATAKVLYAVASDERFRDAKQLRKVTFEDGTVNLEVNPRWRLLSQLVAKLQDTEGVAVVMVNGVRDNTTVATARDAPAASGANPPRS